MKSYTRTIIALTCLALADPMTAGAATVSVSELPGSIQSCVVSGACITEQFSAYDTATAAAFRIFQTGGSGVEQNWLMRYTLASPSTQTHIDPAQTELLGGQLWMLVKSQYDAAETDHPVTLFLDKVSPAPYSFPGQNGDLSLQVSGTDLLTGSSHFDAALAAGNLYSSSGNLSGEVPLICLADNCGVHVDLNLVQLSFSNTGPSIEFTGFDQSDARGLVFGQSAYYQSGDPLTASNDVQTFYVAAVPLPASLYLFGSAVMALASLARRKMC